MSLVFAGISPHPPIIIPEIGKGEVKKVQKTIQGMKKLAADFAKSDPETVIIISPHGLIFPDKMNICGAVKLAGDFANFGAPKISLKAENDLKLAHEISKNAEKNEIETILYAQKGRGEEFALDHGALVPLYYLMQEIGKIKILPISYSFCDILTHFAFGQTIGEIIQNTKQRIAIIASGDLSHRLTLGAPAGFSKTGKIFDQKLIESLEKNQIKKLLQFDEDFLEEAGECGFRSILILLGALDKFKYQFQKYSYEGPFGVGYLVANLKVKTKK